MPFGVPQKQVLLISCGSSCLQNMKPKVWRGPCASCVGVALSKHTLRAVFQLGVKNRRRKGKESLLGSKLLWNAQSTSLCEPETMKKSNCHEGSLHPQRGNFFLCFQENFLLKRGANWGWFLHWSTCLATAIFPLASYLMAAAWRHGMPFLLSFPPSFFNSYVVEKEHTDPCTLIDYRASSFTKDLIVMQ